MGTGYSCKCTKDADRNEVNFVKEREEHDSNFNSHSMKENWNTNIDSTNAKNANYSNDIPNNSKCEDDSNNLIIEQARNGNNTLKNDLNENLTNIIENSYEKKLSKNSSTHHKKENSQEINLEIIEDNLSGDLQLLSQGAEVKTIIKLSTTNSATNQGTTATTKAPLEIINEGVSNEPHTSIKQDEDNSNKEEASISNIDNMSNQLNKDLVNYQYNSHINNNSMISSELGVQFLNHDLGKIENNTQEVKINNKSKRNSVQIQPIINITSVISEHILLNCKNDEVLFKSELKKLVNNEITSHSSQFYSSRFCVITKSDFRYYKSTEQFLTLQKPMQIIPMTSINEVAFRKGNSSQVKTDHLFIILKDKSKIDTKTSNFKNSRGSIDFDTSHQQDNPLTKSRRKSVLLENYNTHKVTANRKSIILDNDIKLMNEDSNLIFTSDKSDLLKKWMVVIEYFIPK